MAPMRWATCTENPTVAAEHTPQNSHRLLAIRPIEAEASAPSWPTMAVSIYCMTMLDSCAIIAGHDSFAANIRHCRLLRGCPVCICDIPAKEWKFRVVV